MLPIQSCGSMAPGSLSANQHYDFSDKVTIEVDSLRIASKVISKIDLVGATELWTKDLVDTVYLAINELPSEQRNGHYYNVMVFNLSNQNHKIFDDLVFSSIIEYQGQKFAAWGFSVGEFTNFGAGGYQNWAMKGWYTRDLVDEAYVVQFTQPKS